MRAIDGKRLIVAEGNGRTALAVPNGDSVEVTTLKEGGMEGGTPAVTVTKGMGWTIEGKLRQRDANNPDADKGPFRLFPIPLQSSSLLFAQLPPLAVSSATFVA